MFPLFQYLISFSLSFCFHRHQDTHLGKQNASACPNEIFHSHDWDDNSVFSVIATVNVVAETVPGSIVDGPFICRQSYNAVDKTFLPYEFNDSFRQNRKTTATDIVPAGPAKRGPPARSTRRKQSHLCNGLDSALHDTAFANKRKRRKKASPISVQPKIKRKGVSRTKPQSLLKDSVNENTTAYSTTGSHPVESNTETEAALVCNSVADFPAESITREAQNSDNRKTRRRTDSTTTCPPKENQNSPKLECVVDEDAVDDYLSPGSSESAPQKNQDRIGPDYQVIRLPFLGCALTLRTNFSFTT